MKKEIAYILIRIIDIIFEILYVIADQIDIPQLTPLPIHKSFTRMICLISFPFWFILGLIFILALFFLESPEMSIGAPLRWGRF